MQKFSFPQLAGTALDQRLVQIAAPLAVTTLAALFRFPGLSEPAEFVFDETFYVKDSYALLKLGYESDWPEDANQQFYAGNPDSYYERPGFIVHPQFGKWIIAAGLAIFGADNPLGWRIGTAIIGLLAVPLLYFTALVLFRSLTLATTAGFLLAIDGHAIVMSRTALLDGLLMFFCLLGVFFFVLDRRWHKRRLRQSLIAQPNRKQSLIFWFRPWLIAAGVALGLATAVKWMGLFFLAAFGIYSVLADLIDRRSLGQVHWLKSSVIQAFANFINLVPIALIIYLLTWFSWFFKGGYYRDWAELEGNAITGFFSWIPKELQSLWHYHQGMFNFHSGVANEHPYESPAWSWLFITKPTLFYAKWPKEGEFGCTAELCAEVIQDIPNPVIWLCATAAILVVLVKQFAKADGQAAIAFTGLIAGYLPWLLMGDRTVYQFYSINFEPYLILLLTAALGYLSHRGWKPPWSSDSGLKFHLGFLAICFFLSIFWLPLWTAEQLPYWLWRLHIWFPSWG